MLRFSVFVKQCSVKLNVCRLCSSTAKQTQAVDTKQVLMTLRRETGYPLITCRQALQASNYDVEKAKEHLLEVAREKGWNTMQSGGQELTQGLVSAVIHKNIGLIIECGRILPEKSFAQCLEDVYILVISRNILVNCETDFVAKTKDFQNLVKASAQAVLDTSSSLKEAGKVELDSARLLKMEIPGKQQNLEDLVALAIGKLKEKIMIRRATMIYADSPSFLSSYIHPSVLMSSTRPGTLGSYASIVSLSPLTACSTSGRKLSGRDIAQHIVGMKPSCIGSPPDAAQRKDEQADGSAEYVETAKPDESSHELLKQPFLLDTDVSVAHWLNYHQLKVNDFLRFQVGEKLNHDTNNR